MLLTIIQYLMGLENSGVNDGLSVSPCLWPGRAAGSWRAASCHWALHRPAYSGTSSSPQVGALLGPSHLQQHRAEKPESESSAWRDISSKAYIKHCRTINRTGQIEGRQFWRMDTSPLRNFVNQTEPYGLLLQLKVKDLNEQLQPLICSKSPPPKGTTVRHTRTTD